MATIMSQNIKNPDKKILISGFQMVGTLAVNVEKSLKCWKKNFNQFLGAHSTQKLGKIHISLTRPFKNRTIWNRIFNKSGYWMDIRSPL